MDIVLKEIRIKDKNQSPYFELSQRKVSFPPNAIIVKVLAFSVDPVMRVWLSGAKTNYSQVHAGDVFNCFGLGIIQKSNNQDFPVNSYMFGNTGTANYFELTQQKQKECFIIDKQLVQKFGPYNFVYLINNGLAAFAGLQILEVNKGQNVVVSTAAGATGLILCHLLKKRGVNIIAISSQNKQDYLKQYTSSFIDYRDHKKMIEELKKIKFSKYFDNVGQSQLDIILSLIQPKGIIAMCGTIDNYLNPKAGGLKNFTQIISKSLILEGINFSQLFFRANQIFEEFKDANIKTSVITINEFIPNFLQIFKKGGSIVGKIIINPHK